MILRHDRTPHPSRAGLGIIELSLAITLLTILMLAITMTTRTASTSYSQSALIESVEVRAYRLIDFLSEKISQATWASLEPSIAPAPLGSFNNIRYRRIVDTAGMAVAEGDAETFNLVPQDGEIDGDGIDNNGNGLIDEYMATWSSANKTVVLARGIRNRLEGEIGGNLLDDNGNGLQDEAGLVFVRDDNNLITIRVSVQGTDSEGRIQTKTVETSVHIRN